MPRSASKLLAAWLVLVSLPMSQLATSWAGTIVCCCGEHDAAHDCGCPDCPSTIDAHDDADGDGSDGMPSVDSVGSCSRGLPAVPVRAAGIHLLLPSGFSVIAPPGSAPRPQDVPTLTTRIVGHDEPGS